MNHFSLRRGALSCEAVPLARIAKEVGTPTYVYSTATLIRHFTVLEDAFKGTPHLHCYAVKASSSLAILRLFAKQGAGFDIVSGGELVRVLAARGRPAKVVFSVPGQERARTGCGCQAHHRRSVGSIGRLRLSGQRAPA